MWPYPKIVAHRGGGTLAPENTIAGLRAGLAYGFRAVEFDVMLSSDGIGVVMHDQHFGRTIYGDGFLPNFTAAELAKMDAGRWFGAEFRGEPVPLFLEWVDYCKEHKIWMNIEIKPAEGHDQATGRWVAQTARARFAAEVAAGDPAQLPLLSSFSMLALAAARDAAPDLPRACLFDKIPVNWLETARQLGAVAIHTNHKYLTAQQAKAVKAAGLGLFCYTVNTPERAREILSLGVDGFCTDRIDLIGADFS